MNSSKSVLLGILAIAMTTTAAPAAVPVAVWAGDPAGDLVAVPVATNNAPLPAYYTIYWPWDQCSADNPACAALGRIDVRTAQMTFVNPFLNVPLDPSAPVWSPFGVTFDVDGTMYTIMNWTDMTSLGYSRLARVDVATGELTYIGPVHDMNFAGPEMDACGNFYATGFTVGDPATWDPATGTFNPPYLFGDDILYRFDKYTGQKTPIGHTGHTDWMDLAFDSKGRLWATAKNMLFLLDPQTGASTFVTNIYGVPDENIPGTCQADWPYMEVMSIAFDEKDVLYATAMRGFSSCTEVNTPVMTIDVTIGVATLIGYTNQPYNHGGDMMPKMVKVAHRTAGGKYTCISINLKDLPAHLAHGDYVPGTGGHPCSCP